MRIRFLKRLNERYLLRYRLEYVVALLLVHAVRSLSPAFAWEGARALGTLCYRLGLRRRPVLANLAVAFPDLPEAERERIALRCYRHFFSVAVDVLLEQRMVTRRNVFRKARITGWAKDYIDLHGLKGFKERARRMLVLTAHLGNWEFASGVFGLLGVEIVPVFRAIRNPFVNDLVRGLRLVSHDRLIERRGAVPAMVEHLDKGGNIGMLFDQEAVHGLAVPFFGLPARTHKSPAVLARDHDVKIFLGFLIREGDFLRYEARGELLDLSRKSDDRIKDLEEITTELMRRVEDEIKRRPEQYL
ncbi:MAG: lysophospholipid acyltransferase family protein, partial [Planctomycetota bacterium]